MEKKKEKNFHHKEELGLIGTRVLAISSLTQRLYEKRN